MQRNEKEIIKNLLLEINYNNYLVIVEGKKDEIALNNMGLKRVVSLKNRPLFEVVENIQDKEVVILTDLDSEGRKLFNKLRYHLQRRGIKIRNKIREELFRTRLRHVEGLCSYLDG